jgi:uncharacterized membrane protein
VAVSDPAISLSRWERATAVQKLILAAIFGAVVTGVFFALSARDYAGIVAWDATSLAYVVPTLLVIVPKDAEATAKYATAVDSTRNLATAIVMVASLASLVAVGYVLVLSDTPNTTRKDLLAALAIASTVLSWAMVCTGYTLRFAHLYYKAVEAGRKPPIDFNQDEPPNYMDFIYLAFTIGMAGQTPDASIGEHVTRKAALAQEFISFWFSVVALGIMVNLVISLA